jgi:hypothetical protein
MIPLTIDAARHIAHNLRPRDREEVLCSLPDGMSLDDWVDLMMANKDADKWMVLVGGDPVAMCGVTPSALKHLASTWAVGTDRKLEGGAELMKTAIEAHRVWSGLGIRRFSCLCLDTPEESSAWLERLGYQREGVLRGFGREGQDFLQWGKVVNRGN